MQQDTDKMQFFYEYYPSLDDTYCKQISFENQDIQVEIVDMSGQYSFWEDSLFIKEFQGFVIIYSIDYRDSFNFIEEIYQDLVRIKNETLFPCIICGNKSDLEDKRVITVDEGQKLAAKLHSKFIETSALSNSNINEMFTILYKDLIKLNNPETNFISTDCCLLI